MREKKERHCKYIYKRHIEILFYDTLYIHILNMKLVIQIYIELLYTPAYRDKYVNRGLI